MIRELTGIKVGETPMKDIVLFGCLHEVVQSNDFAIQDKPGRSSPQIRQTETGQHTVTSPIADKTGIRIGRPEYGPFHSKERLRRIGPIPINLIGRGPIGTYSNVHGRLTLGADASRTGHGKQNIGWIVH